MEIPYATYWRRQAKRTAWRHNLARTTGEFLPFCLGWSVIFACALLVLREKEAATRTAWIVYGIGLLICVLAAVRRSRGQYFNAGDALVRLDWHLGLHNRLSSAAAGVGAFPAPQAAPDGYVFRWQKIGLPLFGAAALVCAAAFVPVPKRWTAYVPTAAPVAWAQTAGWIDALKKTAAIQESALEDLRERLAELHKQSPEDWFSQSSLEAGDNLHEQMAGAMQALQRDLRAAMGNLEAMQKFTDGTPGAQLKDATAGLRNALNGLELGNLPLNRDLIDRLKQGTLGDLKNLSPAQIQALKDKLGQCDKVCEACLRPGEMEGRLAALRIGSSQTRSRPGGAGGGTSSAELNLNLKPEDLGTTKVDSVSNPNLDRALPGDVMGVGQGEHTVDPTKYAGPAAGGTAASNGEGGEAVWRNDLTPQEHAVLKNFFK